MILAMFTASGVHVNVAEVGGQPDLLPHTVELLVNQEEVGT